MLGGGNQCVTAFYKNPGDAEPIKVESHPSEKNVRINILLGNGFIPPSFFTTDQ